jgi:hypothetical protein
MVDVVEAALRIARSEEAPHHTRLEHAQSALAHARAQAAVLRDLTAEAEALIRDLGGDGEVNS